MSPAPVKLAVGEPAPDFDLPTAGGGRVSLSELRGAPALIWFYPAANTSLCTKQACDLRDNHQMFLDAGVPGGGNLAGRGRGARPLRREAEPALHARRGTSPTR